MSAVKTIGIIGGGQLGLMIIEQAHLLGARTICLDPAEDAPAFKISDERIVGRFDDPAALEELCRRSDVVTYEFENVDAGAIDEVRGITATPPNREIHKTALGAELTVAWDYFAATTDCIAALRAQGYLIYVVEQVEGAVMLDEFRPRPGQKYALVFGNEVDGVAQEVVDAADGAIEIPQAGTKHSVNVSVAGGVVLWNFFWQIRPKR